MGDNFEPMGETGLLKLWLFQLPPLLTTGQLWQAAINKEGVSSLLNKN